MHLKEAEEELKKPEERLKKKKEKKTALHNARGLQKTGCPKNNNKEDSDRFTAFPIGADAGRAKISASELNTLQTM